MLGWLKKLFGGVDRAVADREFNYEALIEIAILISNNDTIVVDEVRKTVYDYEFYREYYLSDNFSNEDYWASWFPNSKPDPVYYADYLLDENSKSTFCFLHMLQWLEEKGYTKEIDVAWEYEELLYSLDSLKVLKALSIDLTAIDMIKDSETSNEVFTLDNLIILDKALRLLEYVLVDLSRGGDCYDLAVVKLEDYDRLLVLSKKLNYGNNMITAFADESID